MDRLVMKFLPCPICGEPPERWVERPKYGSRKLFWIGCKTDDKLAGGISQAAAYQIWNRIVYHYRMHRRHQGQAA